MDYYAVSPAMPATSFVQPASISGAPPDHWTNMDPVEALLERQRKASQVISEPIATIKPVDASHTATLAEQAAQSGREHGDAPESDVERLARQRAKILVERSAERSVTAELLARLEILDRRLTEQVPRVSPQQVQALEAAADTLSTLSKAHEERMAHLRAQMRG